MVVFACVMANVRSLKDFWILFCSLHLFDCSATLIILPSAPEVTPADLKQGQLDDDQSLIKAQNNKK